LLKDSKAEHAHRSRCPLYPQKRTFIGGSYAAAAFSVRLPWNDRDLDCGIWA
jgi:hypothetical protein